MANEIIKGMGFHHMALYVSDFDKSLSFYQKLGMKVYTAWGQGADRIALLDTGDGSMLEVFAKPGRILPHRADGSTLPCTSKTWRARCKRLWRQAQNCRCRSRSWTLTRIRARSPFRSRSCTDLTVRSWNLSSNWSRRSD